jgi:hypothetical protein
MSEVATGQPVRDGRSRTIAALVIAAIVVAIGGGAWWLSGESRRQAIGQCQDAVKAKIGFPGSAKFSITGVFHNGDAWAVYGSADSDRQYRFECTVQPGGQVSASVI